jgi:SAM-dependent methyltransferase
MTHRQQQAFVASIKKAFPDFFVGSRVLEVGSLNINGSVRQHFSGGQYIGIDIGAGPDVDVVCQGQDYDAPDGSFDVVISCECLEHNPFWRETFANMLRLCRPGGLVIMTCASTGRPEHCTRRTTPEGGPVTVWDYYRNLTARDLRRSIALRRHLTAWKFFADLSSCDLYFAGFKTGARAPQGASAALQAIRLHYLRKNLRIWPTQMKKRLSILVLGEQRYMAGPLLPWKRRKLQGH